MKQIGTVVEVNEDKATVAVRRASACGENCAMCKGECAPTLHKAQVLNSAAAECGDLVRIETADTAVLKSAFLVYFLPLVILFLCYGVAFSVSKNGATATIAALLGLGAAFFLLRALDRKNAPLPEITKILKKEDLQKEDSQKEDSL